MKFLLCIFRFANGLMESYRTQTGTCTCVHSHAHTHTHNYTRTPHLQEHDNDDLSMVQRHFNSIPLQAAPGMEGGTGRSERGDRGQGECAGRHIFQKKAGDEKIISNDGRAGRGALLIREQERTGDGGGEVLWSKIDEGEMTHT